MSRLQTRILYGLRTDVVGNAHFITDDEVVYPVGNTLSVHNFSQRRQRLIRLPDKQKINLMTISPNKKYVALCEEGEKPLISIYDLQSLKRKKLLGIPSDSTGITSFICISFTYENKYLVVVTNENQTMLFYNWEKGKVESSMDLINTQNPASKIDSIACNPNDTGIIALGGAYVFKFLTVSETLWRPYGFSKAENIIITSLAWINGDRLFAGTSDGRILFLENGDLKNVYNLPETNFMNLKTREDIVLHSSTTQTNDREILCITFIGRGFVFAQGYATIVLFEREGQHKFTKRNIYLIPPQISSEESKKLYRVNTISSNLSVDKLIITTGWSQIFSISLWGPSLRSDPEPQTVDVISHHLHHGPIGGLSVCTWSSLLMTFGHLDRSVRLWDYETENLIMVKQFLEDITCTVLHPTGLFCLIGFSDKLRFMSILIDDFLTIKEFSIRNCKIVAFSYGGHFFGAVNGNIIHIYSTINFSIRFLLKGHTEIIRGITWSQDDTKLLSIGSEGAIYEWDMSTGQRIMEVVLKDVTLYGIVLAADGITSYCLSSDSHIHEIKENAVIRVYNVPNIQPDCLVMGKDNALVYITYPGGYIASLKYPFQDPIEVHEYHIHSSSISQMALTYNEQMLITTGTDGTLCFWKVSYVDGKSSAISEDVLYLDQTLINREDLGGKVQSIKDLNTRIKELETEHAYKMRQTTLQHNEKVWEIHQSYCEAIEELRSKIDKLEEDHTNEINNINVEISKTMAEHEETMRQMEISYDAKLIVEYDKYSSFEKLHVEMREDYERRLAELAKTSKNLLDETVFKYDELHREKNLQLQEAHEEIAQEVRVHEIIKSQIEDDADREIIELRTNYESLLSEERQLVLKLKGEAGVLRNKHNISQKDLENLKWRLNNLKDEYTQLKNKKEELEKDVENLKSEVADKETSIVDKLKLIAELERSNKELENITFVQNHRINDLQNEILPRDTEIAKLQQKIIDIESELLGLNKTKQDLELQQYELKEKLVSTKREQQKEEQRRKRVQQLLRKIRVDLLNAASLIQEPNALKSAVIKLYHRYSDSDRFQRSHREDLDAYCDFIKQRNHLENTIGLLKKKLAKNTSFDGRKFDKLMDEKIELISELNSLKEELKAAQTRVTDVDSMLGINAQDLESLNSSLKMDGTSHCYEELEESYKTQLQECQRTIITLKNDIDQLVDKFINKTEKD